MLDLFVERDTGSAFFEMLRAAQCYSLDLYVVTRDYFHHDGNIHLVLTESPGAGAGDWITANIAGDDICVTDDFSVATLCTMRGAIALEPSGRLWAADAGNRPIPPAIAHRSLRGDKVDHTERGEAGGLFRCLAMVIAGMRKRAGVIDVGPRPGRPRPVLAAATLEFAATWPMTRTPHG